MNWFINLKTRSKLFCGFGLIIVLTAIAIGTSYRAVVELQQRFYIAQALRELDSNFNEQRVVVLTMLTAIDASSLGTLQQELRGISKQNDDSTQNLRELTQADPWLSARVEEFS